MSGQKTLLGLGETMPHDVQPAEVWAFWRFMQAHFGTVVINKRDALEMQLVAQALDALGRESSSSSR
jgi:hypothetical protein